LCKRQFNRILKKNRWADNGEEVVIVPDLNIDDDNEENLRNICGLCGDPIEEEELAL
jgi:hypothetical protein